MSGSRKRKGDDKVQIRLGSPKRYECRLEIVHKDMTRKPTSIHVIQGVQNSVQLSEEDIIEDVLSVRTDALGQGLESNTIRIMETTTFAHICTHQDSKQEG